MSLYEEVLVSQTEHAFREAGGLYLQAAAMTESAKITLLEALKIRTAAADAVVDFMDKKYIPRNKIHGRVMNEYASSLAILTEDGPDRQVVLKERVESSLDVVESLQNQLLALRSVLSRADTVYWKCEKSFSDFAKLEGSSYALWIKTSENLLRANGCDENRKQRTENDLREQHLKQREQALFESLRSKSNG